MAMSREEIQRMIDFSVLQIRSDFNNILQSDGAATVREITAYYYYGSPYGTKGLFPRVPNLEILNLKVNLECTSHLEILDVVRDYSV